MRVLPRDVGAPLREPVTLAALKLQVRADDDQEDDELRRVLIAARAHVERLIGRPIAPRTMRATFEAWPGYSMDWPRAWVGAIELLIPVTSVDAITYTAADGTATAWTGFIARVSAGGVTRVRPASDEYWPTLGVDPVITLDATAGFERVPEDLGAAILMTAAHWHANREAVVAGDGAPAQELPFGVRDIVRSHRWRWLG